MTYTITTSQVQLQYYEEVLATGILPLRMIQIPAGSFVMGSPEDEEERMAWEGPQYQVTLQPFFMAQYLVTQTQWRHVAAMPQVNRELKPKPSKFEGNLHPVEQVSWYDAVEFCNRLTLHSDRQYRLPTEAEWEYACRAGTTTPFNCGNTITTDLANYRGVDNERYSWSGSYSDGPKGEYRQTTTPVDHFRGGNTYGLCDMHGNVWEWCLDHWHDDYESALNNGSAWLSDSNTTNRVRRGGSWSYNPKHCRSACRSSSGPDDCLSHIGFRIVCSATSALP